MASISTKLLKTGTCPITQLPISTLPAPDATHQSYDLSVEYSVIGDNIFAAKGEGNADLKTVKKTLEKFENGWSEIVTEENFIIRVVDVSNIKKTTLEAKQKYIEFCRHNDKDAQAFLIIGASQLEILTFNLASKLVKLPFSVYFFKERDSALRFASTILKAKKELEKPLEIVKTFSRENFSAKFGFLSSDTMYTEANGQLQKELVTELINLERELFSERNITRNTKLYRIINWKNLTEVDWNTRRHVTEGYNKLNREFRFELVVIYGMNPLVAKLVNISKHFTTYPVETASTLEESLEIINKYKETEHPSSFFSRLFRRRSPDSTQTKLLEYIGQFDWGSPGIPPKKTPTEDSMADLYNALDLIKTEFDSVLQGYKEKEAALKISQEQLRTQYDNFPVATYTWKKTDNDFILADFNNMANLVTNNRMDKFLGVSLKDFAQNDPEIETMMNRCFEEKKKLEHEIKYTFQGTGRASDLKATYVFAPPNFIMVHTEDLTEKNRLKEKERLAQTQLLQAAKLASVGTLSSGIAHELNNPLAAIIGFNTLLKKDLDNPEKAERFSSKIEANAERMKRIISHLLSFTRKSNIDNKTSLHVNDIVKSSITFLERELTINNIALSLDLTADLPPFEGDSTLIESVFQNLITNSRDAFSDHPEIETKNLTISTTADTSHVTAVFSDNAGGMPKDIEDHIFEPFFTTKDVGKGTGLGLSVSHGIVLQHKGTISVSSNDTNGTTFKIQFPVHRYHS